MIFPLYTIYNTTIRFKTAHVVWVVCIYIIQLQKKRNQETYPRL